LALLNTPNISLVIAFSGSEEACIHCQCENLYRRKVYELIYYHRGSVSLTHVIVCSKSLTLSATCLRQAEL
jgi:hypothetical protein